MRIEILQSYVSDLIGQNCVLEKNVEAFEADAHGCVARLEAKLRNAASIIKVIIANNKPKCPPHQTLYRPTWKKTRTEVAYIRRAETIFFNRGSRSKIKFNHVT